MDGLPYLAVIWSDPNGDGDPHDAVVLGTARGAISSQGTDTFVATNLSRTIPTANFFVDFLVTQYGQFPAAFDKTGLTGNWLLRAKGTSAAPLRLLSTLSESAQGAAGPFDIELPSSGPAAIECRLGRSANEPNEYQMGIYLF